MMGPTNNKFIQDIFTLNHACHDSCHVLKWYTVAVVRWNRSFQEVSRKNFQKHNKFIIKTEEGIVLTPSVILPILL